MSKDPLGLGMHEGRAFVVKRKRLIGHGVFSQADRLTFTGEIALAIVIRNPAAYFGADSCAF